MDLWVMVNTRAGKQRAREYGEQIREALAREGAVPRLCYTETLEQASALLEEAARRRPDLLVCCGGDGTLSQAVNRLEEQGASLPLGYIPLGTTNDFASFCTWPPLGPSPSPPTRRAKGGSPLWDIWPMCWRACGSCRAFAPAP